MRLLVVFLGLCALAPFALAEKPKVVASIKPIALIAEELAGDAVEVKTLVPAAASAHSYSLKVSDYQQLKAVDRFIWVGPSLETFLVKVVRTLPANRVLALGELADLSFPEEPIEGKGEAAAHHDGHDHSDVDFHIWLDPENAIVMARAIAQTLIALAPEAEASIREREANFIRETRALQAQLAAQLTPLRNRPFVVYHPGYDHFVKRFSLTQLNHVALTPEQKAGARHLAQLQQELSEQAVCLFTEPYQQHGPVEAWAKAAQLPQKVLYPLGTVSVRDYRELLDTLGQSFIDCLTPQ